MKISIAPRTNFYTVPEPHAQALRDRGLPTTFEAISIGWERGQFAIVPLDESSRENAERIVDLWNNAKLWVTERDKVIGDLSVQHKALMADLTWLLQNFNEPDHIERSDKADEIAEKWGIKT